MVGDRASVGSVTRATADRTSERTSCASALVFRVSVTLDTPREEEEFILSTHLISFTSLYILSVTSVSISTGLVPG